MKRLFTVKNVYFETRYHVFLAINLFDLIAFLLFLPHVNSPKMIAIMGSLEQSQWLGIMVFFVVVMMFGLTMIYLIPREDEVEDDPETDLDTRVSINTQP